MKRIGFIGTGIMGNYMVQNLIRAGYELSIFTRTKSKAENLIKQGATWYDSVEQLAKNQDAIITIVGFPEDVDEIYFGNDSNKGLIDSADQGCYLIDMTTTKPLQSMHIYDCAKQKGIKAIDAPVSGGELGAKNASLSIMVGADKDDYDACFELFICLGKSIAHIGPPGCGQVCKAANQIAIAGALAGVCEALSFAKASGLDLNKIIDIVKNGAGGSWQLENMGKKIAENNFDATFYAKHFLKDLIIANEQADHLELELPVLKQIEEKFKQVCKLGYENCGTQSLIKTYGGKDYEL